MYPLVTVGGFVVADDGELLVVRSKKWNNLYTVPGGKVELGETCAQAFEREILEETGLKVTNVRFALTQEAIFSKDFSERAHFVMHDFIADIGNGYDKYDVVLNHENEEFMWVNTEKLRLLPTHKEVKVLLDYYERQGCLVGFENLRITCTIGVLPEEKAKEQEIFVTMKAQIGQVYSDEISQTVDYLAMTKLCENLAKGKHYHLLETYAQDVLDAAFQMFPIKWAQIKVDKPKALANAEHAFVELAQCGH